MNRRISRRKELQEVMRWQKLMAGAVDAAIKGAEINIRRMELSHRQGERRACN